MNKRKIIFDVYDMHCKSCERSIEEEIKSLEGILSCKASKKKGSVSVTYDSELCNEKDIKKAVNTAGYSTKDSRLKSVIGLFVMAIIMIISIKISETSELNNMIRGGSYLILFLGGILSSFHCIGMCGGLMLSQTLDKNNLLNSKKSNIEATFKYNVARIISYTTVGGLAGLLGSIFSISTRTQGFIQIFVAIFMVIIGLRMMGFRVLNNLSLSVNLFTNKKLNGAKNPTILGVLNGLMPCGALQTMQIYALGTGSFIDGALSMLSFALGTLPLMLLFGYFSSRIAKSFGKSIVKYSGVFIVVLGLGMAQRGMSLNGYSLDKLNIFNDSKSSELVMAPIVNGYQEVTVTADGYNYEVSNAITSKLPIRVKFKGELTSGCNSVVYIPSMDKYIDIRSEENTIEMPPVDKDVSFTCWMGMINGEIPFEI